MSEDSLIADEQEYSKSNLLPLAASSSSANNTASASCTSPTRKCPRSNNLDEHIKSVQQKKEEVDVLRLQKFQEQLRKKEQKW